MLRILGLFGFTGGFLVISPAMRNAILDIGAMVGNFVQDHSPYSYVAAAILVFGGITLTLLTGQQAR